MEHVFSPYLNAPDPQLTLNEHLPYLSYLLGNISAILPIPTEQTWPPTELDVYNCAILRHGLRLLHRHYRRLESDLDFSKQVSFFRDSAWIIANLNLHLHKWEAACILLADFSIDGLFSIPISR